jgi:hypothetical protein
LTYRALFTNNTFEIWQGASVTLSTSNNSFKGLNDKPPSLNPWNIGVQKAPLGNTGEDYAMTSLQEINAKIGSAGPYPVVQRLAIVDSLQRGERLDARMSSSNVKMQELSKSARRSRAFAYGSTSAPAPAPYASNIPTRGASARAFAEEEHPEMDVECEEEEDGDEDMGFGLFDDGKEESGLVAGEAPTQQQKQLQLATAASLSHGTTTTYELPGEKTVPPSAVARQHVISEIHIEEIALTYHCVPKIRESVFLSAAITLPSTSTSLLEGPVGLTLDGSFLGQTSIPRKSAGETFKLGLGVDEALTVKQTKPVKKRASHGMNMLGFNTKEDITVYSKRIRLSSAKEGEVKVVVKDQIPVSDNEKLRISVVYPRGLRVDRNGVDVASAGEKEDRESVLTGSKRGSVVGLPGVREGERIGKCFLKKNGEVRWEVALGGGESERKEVELVLEYEARMPSDMQVVASG